MRFLWITTLLISLATSLPAPFLDEELLGDAPVRVVRRGVARDILPSGGGIQLDPGDLAFVPKPHGLIEEQAENVLTKRLSLPLEVFAVDPEQPERIITLEPLVDIAEGGLRRAPSGAFVGRILIGLRDRDRPNRREPLDPVIRIQITGDAAARPEHIEVAHTSVPFTPVEIEVTSPSEFVTIKVTPDFLPKGLELKVPVKPSLVLRASPQRIQGWGLETTELTARIEGGESNRPTPVTLSADNSKLSSSLVQVGVGSPARVELRSNGVGSTVVTAEGPGLRAATETVEFAWPWPFLVAALLGGLVGGLIRAIQPSGPKGLTALRPVVLGILAGLVVAVGYAVGINLIDLRPVARVGEGMVFTLAALGAIYSQRFLGGMNSTTQAGPRKSGSG